MQNLDILSIESISEFILLARDWALEYVLVPSSAIQILIAATTLLTSMYLSPAAKRGLSRLRGTWATKMANSMILVVRSLIWLVQIWFVMLIMNVVGYPRPLLEIIASLLSAWVVIRIVSKFVRQPGLARTIAWAAWIVAALNILQLLEPVIEVLDSRALMLGDVRVSIYTVITTTLALTVLLWLAHQSSKYFERRVRSNSSLSPSVQVLMSKAFTIVVIGLAIVISLQAVGIDLTALAVVGGALGLGLGFGLQKIVANLVSGLILLVDKSIKPGDVIAVEETYGWVDALGARYVSIITRDGTEHLIPNEMLITERVENWTHSNETRRIRLPVGVHYETDVEKAIELCKEVTAEAERVIQDPPVACLITEFGDNSVNLEIRFWIRDAHNGIANVKSDVMLRIWKAFQQNDIEIPYPQRDLHIRSVETNLKVAETLS